MYSIVCLDKNYYLTKNRLVTLIMRDSIAPCILKFNIKSADVDCKSVIFRKYAT